MRTGTRIGGTKPQDQKLIPDFAKQGPATTGEFEGAWNSSAVKGCAIAASDGKIGHVEDFLIGEAEADGPEGT